MPSRSVLGCPAVFSHDPVRHGRLSRRRGSDVEQQPFRSGRHVVDVRSGSQERVEQRGDLVPLGDLAAVVRPLVDEEQPTPPRGA
jgi:hypothetical protein